MRSGRRMTIVSLLGAAALALCWPPATSRAQDSLAQSGLVGELEGITIITDESQWPKSFSEAPALADRVKAGTLPPLGERLPQDLMVIQPVEGTGSYGGTWRRGFTGPGDNENGNRIMASDRPILVDHTGTVPRPSLAKGWAMAEDGRSFTLNLRRGLRWSDGAPMTADDFVFWFEDIYSNKDIVPTPIPDMTPKGQPGRIVKVDDFTVRFEFDTPFFLFEELMAGDTLIGGGQAVRQSEKRSHGAYAPAHYLKQFLPRYAGQEAVEAAARAEGFDSWVTRFHFKKDWTLNTELPVLGPWRTVQPINNATWVMERNPYYWAVDTAGNQLPYMDRVVMTLAENLEVLNLRAIAGEYDVQERHVDLSKLPIILDNQEKGDYTVHLDLAFNGADAIYQFNQSYTADPEIAKWLTNADFGIGRIALVELVDREIGIGEPFGDFAIYQFNQSYTADPEIAKWLTNADFRRALSLAIDREQLNETFWLGTATPGSAAPGESLPYFPGEGWREKWSTFDPAQANALLDQIGLTKKDAQGFRVRTDNGERLRIQVQAVQAFLPWPRISEMVADQWSKVGIQADVRDTERLLAMTRTRNNEHHIMVWNNGGTELLYLFPRHAIPVDPTEAFMGPEFATWYASGGSAGRKPEDPNLLKIFELFSSAAGQKSDERIATAQEIWKILVDQQYGIGTVGQSAAIMGVRLVSNKLGNIPARNCIAQHCRTPGGAHPETWYYKE